MSKTKRGFNLAQKMLLGCAVLALGACTPSAPADTQLSAKELDDYQQKLTARLKDPVERSKLIAKVMGSTVEEERHAYLKFHVFGFTGDGNIIPFFTMNNYVVQKWTPGEEAGDFIVQHYEVAYYSKFDEEEPIDTFKNPLTDEIVELPHFVLGPVSREYTAERSDNRATFAPDPLNITMIGNRVYIPTLTTFAFPNRMPPGDWGPYYTGPTTYWDSMLVFSADVEDVFNDELTHTDAEMHMQNLVSWAPYLKIGEYPGRTMVRAYGQHISGYDALPTNIRKNLEKYVPEIFDIEGWTETRIDSLDLVNDLLEKRANGSLDIDQPGYSRPKVRPPVASPN